MREKGCQHQKKHGDGSLEGCGRTPKNECRFWKRQEKNSSLEPQEWKVARLSH